LYFSSFLFFHCVSLKLHTSQLGKSGSECALHYLYNFTHIIIAVSHGYIGFKMWLGYGIQDIQGGSNMTRTNCDLFTHKSSRSYLNHLVYTTFW
jgi:hypothetical protein